LARLRASAPYAIAYPRRQLEHLNQNQFSLLAMWVHRREGRGAESMRERGELAGKVAVVTGGAAGMGRAIVGRFVAEGAIVVVADRNREELANLVAETGATPHCCDLAIGEAVDAMIDAAVTAHGRIDILVNNAGIPDNYQAVGELALEVWDRMIAVNLTAPMRAMRRAVPLMIASGGGAIVNIGSIASTSGAAAGAGYVAAKHGLIGLNRNTAWMYAKQGIRCNLIKPGWTETGIAGSIVGPVSDAGRDRIRDFVGLTPYKLSVDDIAELALFLASDRSRHINGAEIAADGGLTTA
jgi:NAD(P)-dependent dehydrogenase (short-subunit alcohol dehydrogenase family)